MTETLAGHTPGSLAYWRSSDRVLVVGDAAWHLLIAAADGSGHGIPHATMGCVRM